MSKGEASYAVGSSRDGLGNYGTVELFSRKIVATALPRAYPQPLKSQPRPHGRPSGKDRLEGFQYITQLAIKQLLAQKTGGSIVSTTAALARNPIRARVAS